MGFLKNSLFFRRTSACKTISGRGEALKRGGQTIKESEDEVGYVITQRDLASILARDGALPTDLQPYRREKGDFFWDGGVELSNGEKSHGYLDSLLSCLGDYAESLE